MIECDFFEFVLRDYLISEPRFSCWGCYWFRDASTVFYVGASGNLGRRVWVHLLGGFNGTSRVGEFIRP